MTTLKYNLITKIKNLFDLSSPSLSTRASLLVGIILAIGGILLGIIEGSLAVQINGLIAAIDVLNSLMLLVAVKQSVRQPDYVFNYGYGKYESISILLSAALLAFIGGYATYEAILFYGNKSSESGNYILLLAFSLLSLFFMIGMYKFQKRSSKKFKMSVLEYDAEIWKNDTYIELGVFLNLIIGAILSYLDYAYIARQIDSAFAIILTAFALRVPLKGSKEALNQLLDKTLPDDIQFDIIAIVAENFNNMCEFKSVHTRRSGKDIFVELDIILPYDYSMKQKFEMEQKVQKEIKTKYSTSISRIYAIPCDGACLNDGKRNCPIHLMKKD